MALIQGPVSNAGTLFSKNMKNKAARVLVSSSSTNICPKCGYENRSSSRFCARCATLLAPSSNIAPYSGTGEPMRLAPTVSETNPFEEHDTLIEINSTGKGLLLLVIGFLLAIIPIIGAYLGGIVEVIGFILVFVGRKPFGPIHSRFIKASIALWIIGIISALVVGGSLGASLASLEFSSTNQAALQQGLISALFWAAIGGLVTGAILGIPNVLLTFGLQNIRGRILLLAAYLTSIIVYIVTISIILPQIDGAVAQAFNTQNVTPIRNLQSQEQVLGLLG